VSTLYEAVALDIAALQGEELIAGIADGPNTVTVTVTNVPVEHHVTMKDFRSWRERPQRVRRQVSAHISISRVSSLVFLDSFQAVEN
jgi:hypothetical protein